MLANACYSSSYSRGLAANVALLADLSDKLADYCRHGFRTDGRTISAEEMGEFYYALKKARAFASIHEDRSSLRSWREFARLMDEYDRFAHDADAYRLGGATDPAPLTALEADHLAIQRTATTVREALRSES